MTTLSRVDQTGSDAGALHIGVVVARWNRSITNKLADGASECLEARGVGAVTVLEVPGSLELPVGAAALLTAGCDAVAALGVIIRGDTDHYRIVRDESARGLTLVSDRSGRPVTNGILAVHDVALAVERAQPGPGNKGYEAADAAVSTALALASLNAGRPRK